MNKKKLLKNESVLVVILSETRAHEYTFDLFKKNLLDVMKADLCLCVANNHREDPHNPFYQHAKYIWTYDEPDDWGDAFDAIQKTKGLEGNNWRRLLEIKDQWLGGIKGDGEQSGSAGILLFFRLFLKESLVQHKVLDKYDRFVVTRSDFMHRIPHVPLTLLKPEHIWIPNGEDYGGYTDRHIIAHRNDILNILSIGDPIITEPQQLYADMAFYNAWNLERFIKFSFTRTGLVSKVRRFPYTMYAVRGPEGHTRWAKGDYCEKLGYFVKYKSEYKRFKTASLWIKTQGDWSKLTIALLNGLKRLNSCRKKILRFLR